MRTVKRQPTGQQAAVVGFKGRATPVYQNGIELRASKFNWTVATEVIGFEQSLPMRSKGRIIPGQGVPYDSRDDVPHASFIIRKIQYPAFLPYKG